MVCHRARYSHASYFTPSRWHAIAFCFNVSSVLVPQEVTSLTKYALAHALLSAAALFAIGVAFAHARQRIAANINALRELSIFLQFPLCSIDFLVCQL